MKQTLNLKLSQQLTLTPQLKQSLKLLQLPSLDLEQEIQQAIDTNPLLERVEKEQTESIQIPTIEPPQNNNLMQPVAEATDPSYEIERTDTLAPEQGLDANWQENFEPNRSSNVSPVSGDNEFTQFTVKQETLFEHLNWQIQMTNLSEKDKLIALTILRSLDDDGYLPLELHEIAQLIDPSLDVEIDEIAAVLSLIKTLEPASAGARNLSERLCILLKNLPHKTTAQVLAVKIVTQHLNLLATRNLAKLKKELSTNDQELSEALVLVTQLNPRLSSQFQSDNENHITPDVVVKKIGNKWVAKLNSDNQSKLRVNKTYSDMLNKNAPVNLDQKSSDFINKNMLEAKIFIKGLMSRYDTLLLVSEAIVKRQQGFFEHGEQAMQPMVLQDIAETLEMHESTISRATSGKYLLSPRGVTELKFFFSSALSNIDGATSSSTAIRSLIKEMVESESKAKPLSDNKIANELEIQGHIVARRTVAKYRESMHIAPSSQRKSLI